MRHQPLTAAQLAVLCGVTRRTVTNWATTRDLPHTATPGGHRRYNVNDVYDWYDAQGLAVPLLLEQQCLS